MWIVRLKKTVSIITYRSLNNTVCMYPESPRILKLSLKLNYRKIPRIFIHFKIRPKKDQHLLKQPKMELNACL